MNNIDFEDGRLENFYKLISDNIIRIRKDKNISQLKLANAIGHNSPTFFGKAELLAENKHFNLEHLFKIASVLDVPIEEFFKPIN
jgi:transcriptional regulator with XRE-family HTH domain